MRTKFATYHCVFLFEIDLNCIGLTGFYLQVLFYGRPVALSVVKDITTFVMSRITGGKAVLCFL